MARPHDNATRRGGDDNGRCGSNRPHDAALWYADGLAIDNAVRTGDRPRDAAFRHTDGLAINDGMGRPGIERNAGEHCERGKRQPKTREQADEKHDGSSDDGDDGRRYSAVKIVATIPGVFKPFGPELFLGAFCGPVARDSPRRETDRPGSAMMLNMPLANSVAGRPD
jgi:hypothetical protein